MSDLSSSQRTPAPAIDRNYPEDIRELPNYYSNHAAVIVTSNEVYLDFFQVQPHNIEDNKAQAMPLARLIMTHPQARSFFQAGIQATEHMDPSKSKMDGN